MKTYELTPWIPAESKPIRPGVYNTTTRDDLPFIGGWFQKWDGSRWLLSSKTVSGANLCIATSQYQDVFWRGLASDPNA